MIKSQIYYNCQAYIGHKVIEYFFYPQDSSVYRECHLTIHYRSNN